MAVYTVHQPPLKRPEERRGPDRFAFVRDGFHTWALLFGPLWLIWNGLWLATLGFVVVTALVLVGLRLLGASGDASFFAYLLLAMLLALEAGSLRRWTLRRRGWRDAGLVAGTDPETAERRFFESWSPETMPPLPALRDGDGMTATHTPQESAVIGEMFPGAAR